jgi:HSF-type DNA-binding
MEMVVDNRVEEATPLLNCEEVEKDVPYEEIGAYARTADADLFPQKVQSLPSLYPRSAPSRPHSVSFPFMCHVKLMLVLKHVTKKYESLSSPPLSWLEDGSGFVVYDSHRACEEMAPFCVLGNKPPAASVAKGRESSVNFHSFTRKLYRWGFRQFQHRVGCGKACSTLDEQGLRCRFLEAEDGAPSTDSEASSTCDKRIAFRHPLFHRDHPELAEGIKNKPNRPLVKAAVSPKPAAVKRPMNTQVRGPNAGKKKSRPESAGSTSDTVEEHSAGALKADTSPKGAESIRETLAAGSRFMLDKSRFEPTADRRGMSGSSLPLSLESVVASHSRAGPSSISSPQYRSLLTQALHRPAELSSSVCGAASDLQAQQHLHLTEAALLQRLLELEQQTASMMRLLAPTPGDWLQGSIDASGLSMVQPLYRDPSASIYARTALATDRMKRLRMSQEAVPPVSSTATVLSAALSSFQGRQGLTERTPAVSHSLQPQERSFPRQSDQQSTFAGKTDSEMNLASFLVSRAGTNK